MALDMGLVISTRGLGAPMGAPMQPQLPIKLRFGRAKSPWERCFTSDRKALLSCSSSRTRRVNATVKATSLELFVAVRSLMALSMARTSQRHAPHMPVWLRLVTFVTLSKDDSARSHELCVVYSRSTPVTNLGPRNSKNAI
jgi:hypothetical protein